MTDHGYNNSKGGGVMPCHNSPRRLAHIVGPLKNTRQIEIKPGLLQILYANAFAGFDHENPYTHLTKFYEIAGTLGATEAEEENVFMRMFPHSLIGKAKDWYLDQPAQIMTDWNVLEEKFLNWFFPHNKFMEAKIAIAVFSQGSNETLCEAWERYKSMLRRCPIHGFDDLTQIHIFRNGLLHQLKLFLDVAAGGSLMSKSAEDLITIIEKMALSDHQGQYNRSPSQSKAGIFELGTSDAMLAHNKLFTQTVEALTKQLSKLPQQLKEMEEVPSKLKHIAYCELCSGDHPTGYCPPSNEEVNYMGNQQRQGQYQINIGYQRGINSNYGQGWRQDAGPSNRQYQYENYNQNPPQQSQNSKLEDTLNKFMEPTMVNQPNNLAYQKNNDASIKNFETQLGQMAKQMTDMHGSRNPPPHTPPNSAEHENFTRNDEKTEVIEEFGEENVLENKEECGTMHILKITKPHMTQLPYSLPHAHEVNNEGEKEKLVEKEEKNNQERVKVNKVEIDEVIESICALFNKQPRRTWTPHHLYFKFMEFLPNKLKSKDGVLSVSFWPP
ncbi:hypothetical protein QL285_095012 [Trifolium repens]|nr:hypothetical protein QL285_095012 [Trifolium repens]